MGRHKNRNGFLLTHGSTIFSRCAFLVKPHPVLRRRYSRWMFLIVRLLFSFLSLFSPRLFPTWLAPLCCRSPLFLSVFGHYYAVARARASVNHYRRSRYDRGLNTNYVSVRLFCGFAHYRSYRNALLYRAPGFPRFLLYFLHLWHYTDVVYYFVSILLFPYD